VLLLRSILFMAVIQSFEEACVALDALFGCLLAAHSSCYIAPVSTGTQVLAIEDLYLILTPYTFAALTLLQMQSPRTYMHMSALVD
jgi:hypothetical protein